MDITSHCTQPITVRFSILIQEGRTAIMTAANAGHASTVTLLLGAKADVSFVDNVSHSTPHWRCYESISESNIADSSCKIPYWLYLWHHATSLLIAWLNRLYSHSGRSISSLVGFRWRPRRSDRTAKVFGILVEKISTIISNIFAVDIWEHLTVTEIQMMWDIDSNHDSSIVDAYQNIALDTCRMTSLSE